MDDVLVVGIIQCVGNLRGKAIRALDGQRALADKAFEVASRQIVHHKAYQITLIDVLD